MTGQPPEWPTDLAGAALVALDEEARRVAASADHPLVTPADLERVRASFGVDTPQVLRDHAVSHVLAALSMTPAAEDLVLIGGTALARTHLPTLRLSEDIDLITTASRAATAEAITAGLPRLVARALGPVSWAPAPTTARGTRTSLLVLGDGVPAIRVQLLGSSGYPAWPTELRSLVQRYPDVPGAVMRTLTGPSFAASKTATWFDRRAPRDLYDLWALGRAGHIDGEAAALLRRHGPVAHDMAAEMFDRVPAEGEWLDALEHQGRIAVGPEEAAAEVRERWLTASGSP